MQRLAIGGGVIIGIAAYSNSRCNAPHALWRSQGEPRRVLDLNPTRVWLGSLERLTRAI
jgi:hypothetical protein